MSPSEPNPKEALFEALLLADEEAIANGAPSTPLPDEAELPTELRSRLQRAREVLQLIENDAQQQAKSTESPSSTFGPGGTLLRLGRFEILRELGRGGGGIVSLARDPGLGREVALKVPHVEALVDPNARRRFLREARAAANLDHPHIVPIHEAGDSPVCYTVSAYCRGGSLHDWLAGRTTPVPLQSAARLVADLAEGLAYTHAHHVIHRDVKPGNILLEPRDGAVPDAGLDGFVVRLGDFGLARWTDDAVSGSLTRSGTRLGTLAYMAPEQADPRRGPAEAAADLYGLGTVLYELLTGRPPFVGMREDEIVRQILDVEPMPPGRLRRDIPRDLEAICLLCLEKEPRRRYPSGSALAADLRRWLNGEAVHARRASWRTRVGRTLRRHPFATGVGLVLIASLLLAWLVISSLDPAHRIRDAQKQLLENTSVALIDADGSPTLPTRWAIGAEGGKETSIPGSPLTLSHWKLGLFELLPSVPCEAFEVSAEIRHDGATDDGEVGLYLGHRQGERNGQREHWLGVLIFNDVHAAPAPPQVPPPPGNYLHLALRCYLAGQEEARCNQGLRCETFKPSRTFGGQGPWRPLKIEVNTDGICGYWYETPVGLGKLSGSALNRTWTRSSPPADMPVFPHDGGLGLFVHKSTLAVRSVTVTPLTPNQ